MSDCKGFFGKWFPISISPEFEGLFLCCGDQIEWNMKAKDPADTYFLANYEDERWFERVRPYEEVKIMFWTYLPELPK